ncbi:cystathionine beta-synthase [Arthrobacter caoxuetaonis]|uniref:Cystathionine beta-synthase n=1 Tax=Arthrobacter caoxuetaonis TaxID=2886935 RepID=A0A9X1MC32_9MICC|nr:cystathionine beta-synthase [Arthrobacter caoxuetaonis]MCC3296490.1 cystathionine beta-synthase [Arthrobacter caoxuetaonis]USQ56676.1 cystathionine beta-synthase [Arthrobacter caoxuetaonis]
MKYANTVLDLIGNTPLVKLHHVTEGIEATVLVKLEYLNPGGSIKDRIAVRMIEAAEAEGTLQPGGTIVEPTSGNTGVGLALVAQQKGYKCIFVTPDKVGVEKRDVLRAYGAEVVVTPTAVAPESPESYYGVSDRLVREIDGAYKPDQFSNPAAPASHFESTGPEIWTDTEGKVTHFVAGAGTGGTITGTGRYLKEVSAGRAAGPVKIIAADPEGSVYSGGTGRPYFVEGVGEDMWPGNYDPSVPDEVIAVNDAESFAMTRRLAREEGLLVGGSSGMAVVAALRAAKDLGPDDVMVVLLPDSGRGYIGKIFNDGWMKSHGFLAEEGEDATVADVLAAKAGDAAVFVPKSATVLEAVELLGRHGAASLPVLAHEPPAVLGEVHGSVDERSLTEKLFRGEAKPGDPVSEHLAPKLPQIGAAESVSAARERLAEADTLLVSSGGTWHGILTRRDLLNYLSA